MTWLVSKSGIILHRLAAKMARLWRPLHPPQQQWPTATQPQAARPPTLPPPPPPPPHCLRSLPRALHLECHPVPQLLQTTLHPTRPSWMLDWVLHCLRPGVSQGQSQNHPTSTAASLLKWVLEIDDDNEILLVCKNMLMCLFTVKTYFYGGGGLRVFTFDHLCWASLVPEHVCWWSCTRQTPASVATQQEVACHHANCGVGWKRRQTNFWKQIHRYRARCQGSLSVDPVVCSTFHGHDGYCYCHGEETEKQFHRYALAEVDFCVTLTEDAKVSCSCTRLTGDRWALSTGHCSCTRLTEDRWALSTGHCGCTRLTEDRWALSTGHCSCTRLTEDRWALSTGH